MILIVDTNILFAAVVRDSTVRKILLSTPIKFVVPKYVFDELLEHMDEICEKNGYSTAKNLEIITTLRANIVENPRYPGPDYMEEAHEIMGDIDPNDVAVLATALSIRCDGIWSDDKHFLKQNQLRVWRTKDLVHFIDDI